MKRVNDEAGSPLALDAATVVVVRDANAASTPQPAGATPQHGFDHAASAVSHAPGGGVTGNAELGAAGDADVNDGAENLEVLMLRRNSRGFFGGMWVFPGGRVDPPDRDTPGDVVGFCDPRTDDPQSGDVRGFRTAAVREAHEEAGIALEVDMLRHFAHWMPPAIRAKRFSTHFFICEAPANLGPVRVDGSEILDYAWVTPATALQRRAAGEIEFVTPTFVTLTWLSAFQSCADVLASVNGHTCFHTQLIAAPEPDPGNVAVYVGDAAFPNGDLDAAGPRRRCVMVRSGWRWEEHDGDEPV